MLPKWALLLFFTAFFCLILHLRSDSLVCHLPWAFLVALTKFNLVLSIPESILEWEQESLTFSYLCLSSELFSSIVSFFFSVSNKFLVTNLRAAKVLWSKSMFEYYKSKSLSSTTVGITELLQLYDFISTSLLPQHRGYLKIIL